MGALRIDLLLQRACLDQIDLAELQVDPLVPGVGDVIAVDTQASLAEHES